MGERQAEAIETSSATVWCEAGVVWVRSKPAAEHSLASAQENTAAVARVRQGRRTGLLVDTRGAHTVSAEARRHYGRDELRAGTTAMALIIGSPMSRVIGNFFIGLNHPPVPVRLFTAEDQALAWLAEHAP